MQIASVAKRVLFIGNSLTFWNQGVDVMVKKLVPGIETSRVAVGGATLETLWNNDEAKLACADNMDVVVLQEDLPETTRASFRRHAKLWCDHVILHGAQPVFYAAWAYDRLPNFTDDDICAEHEKVAAENNVCVANVGAARTAGPEGLDLFDDDREHLPASPRASSRRRSTAPRRSKLPRSTGRRICRRARPLFFETSPCPRVSNVRV